MLSVLDPKNAEELQGFLDHQFRRLCLLIDEAYGVVPVRANCVEVVAGHGEEIFECNAPTFTTCCGDNCEMLICPRHTTHCTNCGRDFCQPCYCSHLC